MRIHVRIFETGGNDHGGLHDYETEILPQVGDIISLEGGGYPTSYYSVVRRHIRIDTTVTKGEAVFFVGLEVTSEGSSTTLTRLFR